MTSFRKILLAAGVVLSLFGSAAMPVAAASRSQDCLSNQQVQAAIESGQIRSWPTIKQMAGISDYTDLGPAVVCRLNGQLYFIVNVVSPSGEATKIALNAVNGKKSVL